MLSKYRNKIILAALDAASLALAGVIGLWLRFDGPFHAAYFRTWGRYILVGIPLYFIIYYYFGLYSRVWRYATARDLLHIACAVTVATSGLFAIMYINPDTDFPRSVLIITWFVNFIAVGGSRFCLRVASDLRHHSRPNGHKLTLILGAGDAARIFVTEIEKHPELDFRLVGFLDDDSRKIGYRMSGVSVLGSLELLEEIVQAQGISEIIIAMPSAPRGKIKELVKRCTSLGIRAKTVPGLYRVLDGGYRTSPIRDVQIEDLLSRPEIKTDYADISEYLAGKTVLITGAGGSIGSELSRQVAAFGPGKLLLLGHGENSIYHIHKELKQTHPKLNLIPVIADVQDQMRINQVFEQHRPNVVFHAAAHKHVPLMEHNPTEALKNNVFGTKHVAEASYAYGVGRFVMVSTDKAVNPTSVMGATKRMAELLIQSINSCSQTKFMAVRFGNVLGSSGSVVPLFQEQIARGGPVTVTDPNMTRYFMTIPEAVSLVIQAGAMGTGGEVFILNMGDPVKIVDLARDLITLSGFKPDEEIKINFTGIRPGEKLYEELLTTNEGTLATRHQRIFTAQQPALHARTVMQALAQINLLVSAGCTASQVLDFAATLEQHAVNEAAAGQQAAGRSPM